MRKQYRNVAVFTPQPLRAVGVLFSPKVSGWVGGWAAGYLVETLARGCRCATSWCDLDLTFDLSKVTLTYKILSGLYLGNHKVWEVDTW